MKDDLEKALALLKEAKPHLDRALSKRHYPTMHEDLHYLIQDIEALLAALANRERLPP